MQGVDISQVSSRWNSLFILVVIGANHVHLLEQVYVYFGDRGVDYVNINN